MAGLDADVIIDEFVLQMENFMPSFASLSNDDKDIFREQFGQAFAVTLINVLHGTTTPPSDGARVLFDGEIIDGEAPPTSITGVIGIVP